MTSIVISSSEAYSGKSAICIGLGTILRNKGYSVGYMKPIGNILADIDGVLADEDAIVMRRILDLDDSANDIAPILQTETLVTDTIMGVELGLDRKLLDAHSAISKGKDIVLVEGTGSVGGGAMYNLSDPEVAVKLGAKIILITRYDSIFAVDRILCDFKLIQNQEMFAGIILNEVATNDLNNVIKRIVPFLEKKGIKVFGVIPQDAILRSVLVSDIVEDLHGEVLASVDNLDNLVENYLVGAMEVNSAIKYFRRMPACTVITGGDRSDIQLAAIEAKVKCLVLTGNLRPSEAVLGSAQEADIPVILVRGDTMNTIERMERLIGRAHIKQTVKQNRIVELIESNIDVDSLMRDIGL